MASGDGGGWRARLCCCCCSSRNKVLPVVVGPPPEWDFLEIKPGRRIRVIHRLGRLTDEGAADISSEDEDEDYWFENADPERPPIEQPPPSQSKRIINKFEPQEPPRIPGINPPKAVSTSDLNNSVISPGRLPRKSIRLTEARINAADDDDDDEVLPTDDPSHVHAALEDMNDMIIHITAETTTPEIPRRNTSSPLPPSLSPEPEPSPKTDNRTKSPKTDNRTVLTIPDPGESSTDAPDATTTVQSSGTLGGHANVAFQNEEEGDTTTEELAIKEESKADTADAGYSRHRNISDILAAVQPEVPSTDFQNIPLSDLTESSLPDFSSEKPAVFFVHGVGGSATTWTNQLDFFVNSGYEVIAPDLLGHGFSSAPDNSKTYTFPKLFRDVITVFDHYIPEKRPAVIVAHSYGSSFAAALARARPENVVQLILIASGGPTPLAPPPGFGSLPTSVVAFIIGMMKFRRQQKYSPRGKSIKFEEAFDVPPYVFRHIMTGQNWPEGDASFHRRISCPTLLVYGLKDNLVSLVEMCEMERTIPKAYLELVPLAGHMVMLEQPKQLNTMIKKFIEKYRTKEN